MCASIIFDSALESNNFGFKIEFDAEKIFDFDGDADRLIFVLFRGHILLGLDGVAVQFTLAVFVDASEGDHLFFWLEIED